MCDKEAKEQANKKYPMPFNWNEIDYARRSKYEEGFNDGANFGYNKANEWHKVSDKLPEMDVLVYIFLDKVDDFPVVARRHIPYGKKEWVWDCKWGSGYTVSQLAGKYFWWKEIVLPKE